MKLSGKIKYMCFGGVIALVGFGIGSLLTGIDAQNNVAQFDSISARNIVVTDFIAIGDSKGSRVLIAPKEHGGSISVLDKDGDPLISLLVDESGGVITIVSGIDKGNISLRSDNLEGGVMSAESSDGKTYIMIASGIPFIEMQSEYGRAAMAVDLTLGGIVEVERKDGVLRKFATQK